MQADSECRYIVIMEGRGRGTCLVTHHHMLEVSLNGGLLTPGPQFFIAHNCKLDSYLYQRKQWHGKMIWDILTKIFRGGGGGGVVGPGPCAPGPPVPTPVK